MNTFHRMAAGTLLLAAAAPGFAYSLHFGLKAGVPTTVYFETGRQGTRNRYSAATRRYTAGLSVEWRLTDAFGFELEVLYKRMGYVGIVSYFSDPRGVRTTSAFDVKGNSWDIPLMAKRRFGRGIQPYVAGGGVLRYVGPVRARGEVTTEDFITRTTTRAPIDTTEPSDLRKRFYPGLTAGAGIEFGIGRLRLLPEFRYTHWTANIAGPGGLLRFSPNQAEFLLGLLF